LLIANGAEPLLLTVNVFEVTVVDIASALALTESAGTVLVADRATVPDVAGAATLTTRLPALGVPAPAALAVYRTLTVRDAFGCKVKVKPSKP
jgi:hypothetical protein